MSGVKACLPYPPTRNVPKLTSELPKGHSVEMALPAGLEPATYRLEVCCSIQLSYGSYIESDKGYKSAFQETVKHLSHSTSIRDATSLVSSCVSHLTLREHTLANATRLPVQYHSVNILWGRTILAISGATPFLSSSL